MVKPITKTIREYLADIGAKGGKKGGKASSKAKSDAAKKNGKKGGRPKNGKVCAALSLRGRNKMGDGLRRASDYANSAIAPFLRDVKTRGTKWKVADNYLIAALGGQKRLSSSQLPQWVKEFADRHELGYTHDDKQAWYEFTRRSETQ